MDKRSIRRRLHKNCNAPSGSQTSSRISDDPEDDFLNSSSREPSTSQRESNSDKLRKLINQKKSDEQTGNTQGRLHKNLNLPSGSQTSTINEDGPVDIFVNTKSRKPVTSTQRESNSDKLRKLIAQNKSDEQTGNVQSKLHENLNLPSGSQTPTIVEESPVDVFLNSSLRRPSTSSQRESNSDKLRKLIAQSKLDEQTGKTKKPYHGESIFDESPEKRQKTSERSQQPKIRVEMNAITDLAVDQITCVSENPSVNKSQTADAASSKRRNNAVNINVHQHQKESTSEIHGIERNKFDDFLVQAGVKIDDNNSDDICIINNDPMIIAKKMKQLLDCGDFNTNEVLEGWNAHVPSSTNETYLKWCLNSTNVVKSDEDNSSRILEIDCVESSTLLRILFQVPQLQTRILSTAIYRLNEIIVGTDDIKDEPWTLRLLQQIRYIGTIHDTELLTLKLEELLESSPIWFLRELISYLPDIILDSQHENIVRILCRLLEIHNNLTNTILDCITNLTLGKEFQEELREKMLKMLQHNCAIYKVPAIIRFCLNECSTIDSSQNVLSAIRSLNLEPIQGENFEEYYENQVLIVNEMKMKIIMKSDMANAAALVTSSTENSPKSFDIIMLLLLYDRPAKKKKAEAILKQHIKSGFYTTDLLSKFYKNCQHVARNLQPIALRMASYLLKLDDRVLVDFSSEWFRQQFLINGNLLHKQREIIEKLIILMSSNDQTAKTSLAILCKMTKNDDEKSYLQKHCNHLRILMEKVDNFSLEEVIMLNDLLHALCTSSSSVSETLRDDLYILLQKQLSSYRDSMIKSKGVAGAVMAIKHLSTNPKHCKLAKEIFQKVQKSIKNCPRSQGFFYDKIGSVIADTQNIDENFLKFMTDAFEEEFINTYMTDLGSYSGELESVFGLNEFRDESDICVVQFGVSKYGGAMPPVLLRLMGICFKRMNGNENVENINALLGCAILMPKDLNMPDSHVLDYLFYCINWFRELINIFVTQTTSLLQRQVSKRLDNIIDLQSELSNLLMFAEPRYQSPFCYFHLCPSELTPFKLVEKKVVKKGKRAATTAINNTTAAVEKCGTVSEHREKWEIASLLSTKNPMYFRRLEARILNFIDISMNTSQYEENVDHVSTSQLCFIIKELSVVFEDDAAADETFMGDLICLLPKICKKLKIIVKKLESEDNHESEDNNDDDNNNINQNKQALRLILTFLSTIFRWKQFKNPSNSTMLRDGLRILAGQTDKSNLSQSSCKKLVGEAYEYFESLARVATQIPIAFALVDICKTLMKHSVTFTRQHQDKQAIMAYGFLCLEWPDDRHTGMLYKSAVVGLLKNWMDHEPKPLNTVTSILEWLPDEVTKMEKPQDKLARLPTINKSNFHLLILKIFDGLIKGTEKSLSSVTTDSKRLELLRRVAENIQKIVSICKKITTRSTLMVYLRYMPLVLKQYLASGMPILERNLRYQTEEITRILKMMQGATRYLNAVCVHSTEKKDLALTKLVPAAKTILERLLYSVKGMLVLNNSSTAFWMGNLVNKDLDGQEILSQNSNLTDGEHTSAQDSHTSHDEGDNLTRNTDEGILSDLLDSDNDDMIVDDGDADDNDVQLADD